MGKYIKLFENHSQYETFIGGGGDSPFIKPNVSYCIQENDVHYNPRTQYTVRLKYIVPDLSNFDEKHWDSTTSQYVIDQECTEYDLPLCNESSAITEIKVNGVTWTGDAYHVTTEDEGRTLIAEIWLNDDTTIPSGLFNGLFYLSEADLGASVLSIGDTTYAGTDAYGYGGTFGQCNLLSRVNLNNCVSIGSSAFALSAGEHTLHDLNVLKSGRRIIDIDLSKVIHIGTNAFTGRYITTPTHFNESLPSSDIDTIAGIGGLVFTNGVWLPNSYTTINTPIIFCAVDETYDNFIDYKTNIHLGNAVDTIQYANIVYSFTPFEIPQSVTTMIGSGNYYGVFGWMGSYNNINPSLIVYPTTPPLANDRTFYNTYKSGYKAKWAAIYVPNESVDAYKSAAGWSSVASVIKSINEYTG